MESNLPKSWGLMVLNPGEKWQEVEVYSAEGLQQDGVQVPQALNEQQLYEMQRQGVSRENAVAALDVADNDGEAAMLYHVANLDKGGAAATAAGTFVDCMAADGIARADAEAALAHTQGRGRQAALFARRCHGDTTTCTGAAAVISKLQRLNISSPAHAQQLNVGLEATQVLSSFMASAAAWQPKITRVQNPGVWAAFCKTCRSRGLDPDNCRLMFHGTSTAAARQIAAEGFHNSTTWFAGSSQTSLPYCQRKDGGHQPGKVYTMVAARIASGTPCKQAGGQDIITVPSSNQCYPQYIISFTHG